MPEYFLMIESRGGSPRGVRLSTPRRVGLFAALLAWLGLSAMACGPGPVVPRVGDSLLDLITQEHIEAYPASNLPAELSASERGEFVMRSLEFRTYEWITAGPVPDPLQRHLGPSSGVRYWYLKPHIPHAEDFQAPRVLVEGEFLEPWIPGEGPFPGLAVWYEPSSRSLFALAAGAPAGVAIEYSTNAGLEFAGFEKLLAAGKHAFSTPNGPAPDLRSLLGRVELKDNVSRPCVLLPAGGAITVPFESFPAQGIRLAVGVADHGFEVDSGSKPTRVKRAPQQSDGATFVLEVIEGSRTHEVWTKLLFRGGVGRSLQEASVDLSAYQGKSISLRLRTEAGPAGDANFDYGLWSDLRLLGEPAEPDPRPHIVLIDIDTLRADRLASYGHSRPTTPRIDAWFEKHGVRYEDARAPAPWTLPSTASMLTGLAPHQHRVLDHDTGLASEVDTLATILRRSGYETFSVSEGPFFRRAFGLDMGFDKIDNPVGTEMEGISAAWMRQVETLRTSETGRPAFLFLQTYLVHTPYEVDERFVESGSYLDGPLRGESIRNENVLDPYHRGELELTLEDKQYINALYDAGVARMDEIVGAFLDELDVVLEGRQALVILTSDHGEEFWEHGQMGHGRTLYDEVLRVPMFVRFPSSTEAPRFGVSHKPVSLLDIVPTALDVAGLEIPSELAGLSLRSELPDRRPRIAMLGERLRSFEFDSEKLILGEYENPRRKLGPVEYYHLGEDAGETSNLADESSAKVQRLDRALESFIDAHRVVAPEGGAGSKFDADEARRLRELGYLGGG